MIGDKALFLSGPTAVTNGEWFRKKNARTGAGGQVDQGIEGEIGHSCSKISLIFSGDSLKSSLSSQKVETSPGVKGPDNKSLASDSVSSPTSTKLRRTANRRNLALFLSFICHKPPLIEKLIRRLGIPCNFSRWQFHAGRRQRK